MAELPEPVEQVKVLRLRPDDRLVVTLDVTHIVTAQDMDRVRAEVAAWAGIDVDRVLVTHTSADLSVLRPEDDDG